MKDWLPALLWLLLLLPLSTRADLDSDIEQLGTRLQQYQSDSLSAQEQATRDKLQKTLDTLEQQKELEQRIDKLRQELIEQPERIAKLKQQPRPKAAVDLPSTLESLNRDQLQQRLTLVKASLLDQRKERERLQQEGEMVEQKRLSLREQLSLLQRAGNTGEVPGSGPRDEASQLLENARFEQRSLQMQALELELLALPGRAEINTLQLEALNLSIARNEVGLEQLEQALRQRLRSQTEEAISGLQSREQQDPDPAVQTLGERNIALSEEMRQVLNDIEAADNQRRQLEQHLKSVDEAYRTISQQLELNIRYVGTELHQLLSGLSRPLNTERTRSRINELRLRNLQLSKSAINAEQVLRGDAPPEPAPAAEALARYRSVLGDRAQLLEQLRDANLNLITELSTLLSVQTNINERTDQARKLINQKLLWLPSVTPIGLDWAAQIAASRQLLGEHWQQMSPRMTLKYSRDLPAAFTALALVTLAALWLSPYQKRKKTLWRRQIGNVMQDRFWNTLRLLLFGPLIALPVPLLLYILATRTLDPSLADYFAIQPLLLTAASVIWAFHCLWLWLSPSGLFNSHFGLDAALARTLRRRLIALFLFGLPLLLAVIYILRTPLDTEVLKPGLERLLMLALTGLIAMLWGSLLPSHPLINKLTSSRHWWMRAEFWIIGLVAFNLLLMIMMLIGYVFTAQVLMLTLLKILLTCLAVFIIHRLTLRWLLIAERKLSFDRSLARRAEMLAAREKKKEHREEEPPVSTDYLNIQTISEQSRKLLAALCWLLLLVLLWLNVGDLLPALDVLDQLVLWSSISTGASGEFLANVTLKDLLLASLLLGLSILAASNLPGLLELLILRHMTLAPGTGYAVTTLIRYALIMAGILFSADTLGLQWSKLQWLVAALGVGLGFGLQEIVANFVSGLIILFEKPARIGDTVTIGGVSGTVTRIQIRSTTVVDWDRKEVIIPNKTFITDQLINWSLTDSTTRIVIPVGVAYGSDTDRARILMVEAARETERVLTDPKPEAFFIGFGASTLDLELRLFVSSMADRLEVTHSVNSTIARKFADAGLEIAFPQLDVHLYRSGRPSGRTKPAEGED
ncbi:miniconductance mechanosensitive channel MscM [Marinobacterium nitratireducens]|uniref:Miniconductance mechanosensitive channel MscM n=1 Tax=Marinobacterium nitratireducens TaxID=518897 RepID=A0A918DPG0_9GAMM|nr:mechanosensitive ion channel domain-containing protein [Marinobacterium nitratireducens]GGO78240.1 miniconductance mechanosensitive channel MscM [Marinobacterium nitratireducens]